MNELLLLQPFLTSYVSRQPTTFAFQRMNHNSNPAVSPTNGQQLTSFAHRPKRCFGFPARFLRQQLAGTDYNFSSSSILSRILFTGRHYPHQRYLFEYDDRVAPQPMATIGSCRTSSILRINGIRSNQRRWRPSNSISRLVYGGREGLIGLRTDAVRSAGAEP